MKVTNTKGIAMKNSTKKFFFGVVLLGGYRLGIAGFVSVNDLKSLYERSPFGDNVPKPEPKPQTPSAPKASAPSAPPAPKQPEMKIGLSGYVKVNGKNYYSICDTTSKEPVHMILTEGESSPSGCTPGKFDEANQVLEVKVDGRSQNCKLGEDEKKKVGGKSTASQATQSGPKQSNYNNSSQGPASYDQGNPFYRMGDDFEDFDYLDDFDDFDDGFNWGSNW
jgi:hypothetical protein